MFWRLINQCRLSSDQIYNSLNKKPVSTWTERVDNCGKRTTKKDKLAPNRRKRIEIQDRRAWKLRFLYAEHREQHYEA